MEPELQKVRNEIPLYNETKLRLYKYFITKEITSLVINNDEYMKSLEFVSINSVSSITLPQELTNNMIL